MEFRNKFVSQISRADILDLIAQQTAEDDYFEFKTELLHPTKKPPKLLEDEKEDLLADLVAFANAAGGLILIGISEDAQGRASGLAPVTGDEAKKLANTVRDLAVAYIRPGIIQLEVVPFQMKEDGSEWIVVIRVPDGVDKPYMSKYKDQTWVSFTIRVGNRKRAMAYEEIQQRFLANPQQERMAQIVGELESIKSLISDLGVKLGR
jgi:predicted HTH transcriptional regulator